MLCAGTMWSKPWNLNPNHSFPRASDLVLPSSRTRFFSPLSSFPLYISLHKNSASSSSFSSSSSSSSGYAEEPATNVKFQTYLNFPGFSNSLTLLGTGYREKAFAIIGVKVYAAGFYINPSIVGTLDAWKGQSAVEIQGNSALFNSVLQAPYEKSLQIVLVRNVDGKTFWDALDDAISPRIKVPTLVDESALTTFCSIFQGRSLQQGTFICLTWLDHSNMLVSISPAQTPDHVDARIESGNVTFALFDTFFGVYPVSPSLKGSVANRLATMLR